MENFTIRPVNLIKALSTALELAVNGMDRHHWRTAVICKYIAECMGLETGVQQRLIYAALLHDIGAASNWDERRKLKDTDDFLPMGVYKHAEDGYSLLRDSTCMGALAEPIRHHHDKWEGGNLTGLAGEAIPLLSRILHIADRVEVLIDDQALILPQRTRILGRIEKRSGIDFDPQLVALLEACTKPEGFWLDLANPHYHETFFDSLAIYGAVSYSMDDAIGISEVFATIIDRMSKFTAHHSRSVAHVAVFLAEKAGFSAMERKTMQIAGLLHDLGKLSVPNEILEKPGALTAQEIAVVRQHTYYTYRILEKIDQFETIAKWAAYHHECLDGSGYPFKLDAASIPLGSRIVAVADVFVALTEDRPYRATLPEDRVKSIMRGMVKSGKLDEGPVELLLSDHATAALLVGAR